METIRIAPARTQDIPLLAEYRYSMFADMFPEEDFSAIRGKFTADVEAYYLRRMENRDELNLFAWVDGEPAGCGSIIFEGRPPNIKHTSTLFGYILNISVRPEYRRRGIATSIMRALEAEAKKRGVKKIGLHASKAGARLYGGIGYFPKESYMESDLEV